VKHKNTIQVFEHQKLYFNESGPFKEVHWKALARYAEIVDEAYYSVLGKGIKFSNFVGVIQARNLTIEVLPKTDTPLPTAENAETRNDPEKNLWHQVLIDMLRECRLLKAEESNKAFLRFRDHSLLELYLQLFLTETERLLHEGLIKKYSKEEGNQLSLKGQLLFSRNLCHNIVHNERFYVRHTVYNSENIFNQLLYKTLLTIPKISNNSFVIDQVNRILFSFPELGDIKVSNQTFKKLTYDRKTERYRDALMISKMILLNFHPDIMQGSENVVAILFDMNKLWEEFVYRRLRKEEKNFNFKVSGQTSKEFWKPTHFGYSKTVRPDIVVTYELDGKAETVILDTKWKVLQKLTPSDDDLKQMFVYNLLWKSEKSFLIYPSNTSSSSSGDYHYARHYLDENVCSVEAIAVLSEERKMLDRNFGCRLITGILGQELVERLRVHS
jgi:5-methylcytosine-specific restriction enzyme subunit McrC